MDFILALDGGGMRGIIALTVLEQLTAQLGEDWLKRVDLIAGTSMGGIALGLAAGKSSTQLLTNGGGNEKRI